MKRKLLCLLTGLLLVGAIPVMARPFCFTFDSHAVQTLDPCTVKLTWSFEECGVFGSYLIEYSTDGFATYHIVNTIEVTTIGIDPVAYNYTDNFAHPSSNTGSVTIYYRIVFESANTGTLYPSPVMVANLGNSSCSMNYSDARCSSLPSGLSIQGLDILCAGSNGNYLPSSSLPVIWSFTSGGSFVTTNGFFGSTLGVINPSTNGQTATLSADVYGCRVLFKTITLGVPPDIEFSLTPSVNPFCTNAVGNTVTTNPQNVGNMSFEWGFVDEFGTTGPVVVSTNGSNEQDFVLSNPSLYQIYARGENSCGYFLGNTATLEINASDNCFGGLGGMSVARKNKAGQANALDAGGTRLSLFPNPAADLIALIIPDSFDIAHTTIKITDLLGRRRQTVIPGSYSASINIAGLGRGMFIMEIYDGKRAVTRKFIKQ